MEIGGCISGLKWTEELTLNIPGVTELFLPKTKRRVQTFPTRRRHVANLELVNSLKLIKMDVN